MACVVALVAWKGIGFLPVVIDERGGIIRLILLWQAQLQSRHRTAFSTLRRNAYGLARCHDFWTHYQQVYRGAQEAAFLPGLWQAMRDGDAALGWQATRPDTARQYMTALNLFTDWLAGWEGGGQTSACEDERAFWHALLGKQVRHLKAGPRSPLPPLRGGGDVLRHGVKVEAARAVIRRQPGRQAGAPGTFLLDDFNQLILHEKQPRLLLLWLLLGAGGVRISEVMHLYATDVCFDAATHEARVTLADPCGGEVNGELNGGPVTLTREEFLRFTYDCEPRNRLPDTDILRAGWKGLKRNGDFPGASKSLWLHSIYGQMAWAAHTIYLKQRTLASPLHPWYLVNLGRNVGKPLTISNVQSLFARACRRLNLGSPGNPHSLRRMYVEALSNGTNIPIENVQAGLRRSSLLHTMAYVEAGDDLRGPVNGRGNSKT